MAGGPGQDSCIGTGGTVARPMSQRLLVTRPLPDAALAALAPHCEVVEMESPADMQSCSALHACHGLLCLLTDRIDEAVLAALPDLEFVSSVSVGVDHIDVGAMTRRGVAVGNTPGVLVDATADTAFALLLSAARRVVESDRYIRAGSWGTGNRWSPDFFLGKDVSGATLGVIGLGPIGQAMARRALGFGMQVLGWTPSQREVANVENVSLEQLLQQSDFVSVHIALSDSTRNLINANKIDSMKPGAVLINTARGGIVDEQALAEALNSGQLFAAGLDVFAEEPVSLDSPLLQHPRVVVTPHIGSATSSTREKMLALAVANAIAALRHEPMPHCVNPEVYNSA